MESVGLSRSPADPSPDAPPRPVLLRCVHPGGTPRYELWSLAVGWHEGYAVHWRPAPARVFHHGKQREIVLPHAEFVLVGVGVHHCISMSVDAAGVPLGAYVNINLEPVQDPEGWSWQDLELDLKVGLSCHDDWAAMLLDWDEFEAARLLPAHRAVAVGEIRRVLEQVRAGRFPFALPRLPWLGLHALATNGTGPSPP